MFKSLFCKHEFEKGIEREVQYIVKDTYYLFGPYTKNQVVYICKKCGKTRTL